MKTRRRATMVAAAIVALACVGSLQAHHSTSMFEIYSPVWLEGTVVRFDRINPHSIIAVEEKTRDGQTRRWAVEGPDPGQLNRRGIPLDFLNVGDVVKVCAFPLKDEFLGRYSPRDTDGTPRRFVHGHLLVRKGQKSMWGSYGTLAECVRSSGESRQSWLEFLNSDPQIQSRWCEQLRRPAVQSNPALNAYVEEISRQLTPPCR